MKTKKTNTGLGEGHYNREQRLERASPQVRALHDEKNFKSPGLLKALVASKGSRAIFFAVVLLVVVNIFFSLTQKTPSKKTLAGIMCELNAVKKNQQIFVSLVFAEKNNYTEETTIAAVFSGANEKKQIVIQKTMQGIYLGNVLVLHSTFPETDVKTAHVHVVINGEHGQLSARIKE